MIGVITNLNSTRNRDRPEHVANLREIVNGNGLIFPTSSVDAIKPALRELLRAKATYCVVDGGDGAFHHALWSAMELRQEKEFAGPLPHLVPTGGGGINFLARYAGNAGDSEDLIRTLCARARNGAACEMVEADCIAVEAERPRAGEKSEIVRTIGFAIAAGGIGENLMKKYNEAGTTGPQQVARILGKIILSYGVSALPGRARTWLPELNGYSKEIFAPTFARVTVDGRELPFTHHTAMSLGSLNINVGGLLRFFPLAKQPGKMQIMVGAPAPIDMIRALPRMMLGRQLTGIANYFEAACEEVVVEARGDRLLDPLIDGEQYRGFRRVTYRIGERIRVPRISSDLPDPK